MPLFCKILNNHEKKNRMYLYFPYELLMSLQIPYTCVQDNFII